MRVLIIDAQGGGIGRALTQRLREAAPDLDLVCVGTNSLATEAMLRAGASRAATGENAVVFCAARADIIAGPVGIVIADAMLGEITPKMAEAVGRSRAKRILIPAGRCDTLVAGVRDLPLGDLVRSAAEEILKSLAECR